MSIQVRNISHIYSSGLPHQSIALSDVSFDIEDGEFIGIIGHTGSGKSTLLQHLNGLLKPQSGTIVVSGTEITGPNVMMRDVRRKIGLVFQYPEYQLFEETVHKDVAFGPLNLGLSNGEADLRVREALELVGLDYEDIANRSPFDLSGGQKRRVAIAGVIAMKPEVLILDEPTAGLDPKAHGDVLRMLNNIHEKQSNITILVSHNMADIANMAHRVFVMDNGKLVLSGTPEEVFSEADKLTAMGLGLPPAAELMAKLAARGFAVRKTVFSAEAAEEEIWKLISKEGSKGSGQI